MKEVMLVAKIFVRKIPRLIFWLSSFIHAIIPFSIFLARDVINDDFSRYWSVSFWVYTCCLGWVNIYVFNVNNVFIDIARVDIMRKLYYMRCMESMLEPNRYKLRDFVKFFPLLNYFDP
jgi:hypothetical protein